MLIWYCRRRGTQEQLPQIASKLFVRDAFRYLLVSAVLIQYRDRLDAILFLNPLRTVAVDDPQFNSVHVKTAGDQTFLCLSKCADRTKACVDDLMAHLCLLGLTHLLDDIPYSLRACAQTGSLRTHLRGCPVAGFTDRLYRRRLPIEIIH